MSSRVSPARSATTNGPPGLFAPWIRTPIVCEEVCFDAALEPLHLDPLYREEAQAVEDTSSKGQREFRAGRHCARRALAQLGSVPSPLCRGTDNTPLWPEGVVGSISHCGDVEQGYAVAVVARREHVAALGVDAERERPLSTAIWDRVLTPAERRRSSGLGNEAGGWLAMLTFSAKESVFKCQYPLLRTWLGFQDVEIDFNLSAGTFRVEVCQREVNELFKPDRYHAGFRSVNGWLGSFISVDP